MAPSVCFTTEMTPVLFSAPCVVVGQLTVSPLSSFQVSGAPATRNLVKLLVVPEPSERWTTVILVDGRSASGLSALMASSSQLVISAWKILAMVSGLRLSSSTPSRL